MNATSVHDNIVTGYSVSCSAQEIVLHTAFPEAESTEQTDVVFSGVEAYHLVGDNLQTILSDVAECAVGRILESFSSEFASGVQCAWPGAWNVSPEACVKHLAEAKCRGWIISSSFGMGGFVIAQSVAFVEGGQSRS